MGCQKHKEEIIVCNTLFKYDLVDISEGVYDLVVSPCSQPTAVYNIGRITVRENTCIQSQYFQGFINSDPVEIIQDCSLEGIIRRMIEEYFANTTFIDCSRSNGCRSNSFGLF